MRWFTTISLLALAVFATPQARQQTIWASGSIRAAYLASNPAQAVLDPATGEVRGVVVDLGREIGRLHGLVVTLIPLPNPQRVIDAVRNGEADFGFVAYNPERAGPVEFSQPYLLVQQTFLVPVASSIRSIGDLDVAGRRLGATRADSIALYLRRSLKQGQLVELDDVRRETVLGLLADGQIHAFGANRQRLTDLSRGIAAVRLLADDLYGVEQTIIVPAGHRAALDFVNQFIDEIRRSGFLRATIERSGIVGIALAGPR